VTIADFLIIYKLIQVRLNSRTITILIVHPKKRPEVLPSMPQPLSMSQLLAITVTLIAQVTPITSRT
jgi:hypothetical protein